MKKATAIISALLILVSGMHISMASHICGGKVAAVKWSFSNEVATCGMEDLQCDVDLGHTFGSRCCLNQISTFTVDNTYAPATWQINEVLQDILPVSLLPEYISPYSLPTALCQQANVGPPVILSPSAVRLAQICVFRI